MGVDDHGAGAVRDDRAREFGGGQLRAFDMEMAVNQTGSQKRTVEIDGLARLVIPEANDAAVIDGDIGIVDFTAEDVDGRGRS